MCGISGIVDKEDVDSSVISKMSNCLKHRGPDDAGEFFDDNIALGHRRLSIIDLDTGDQPITTESGLTIIYNGEVYNFHQLRKNLIDDGISFHTESDTEVVLRLFEKYREKSFSMLNGMFALAIWDANSEILYLARDRSGIKPLYYYQDGSKLVFGSEIKSILLSGQYHERQVNRYAFHLFFNLRYVPGTHTFFTDIHKLEPGKYLKWQGGSIQIKQFWKPNFSNKISSYEEAKLTLRRLLEQAIHRHMISDVEVGSYLSGGIDSSIIVAIASQQVENLKTFSLGFDQPNDELRKAKKTAEFFDTDHHERIISSNFLDDAPKIMWYSEFPKRNLYPYYLSEIAAPYVKVVLSGLGADELFGGYTWKYDLMEHHKSYTKLHRDRLDEITKSGKTLVNIQSEYGKLVDDHQLEYLEETAFIDDPLELYVQRISLDQVFNRKRRERFYGDHLLEISPPDISKDYEQYFELENPFKSVQYADYHSKMVNDFLHVDDSTTMAHSIESRVPFLDNTLVDFAFSVPTKWHYKDGGKKLLKDSVRDILPKWVLEAPKQGFSISMSEEYMNRIRDYGKLLLPNGHAVDQGLIQQSYIDNVLKYEPQSKMSKHYYTLWNLLYFEVWYDVFIEREMTKLPRFSINALL